MLAAFAAALIATWLLGWWSIPFWIWAVFALQFFRDPARVPPADADAVIAPADGRIVVVEKVNDPYLEREALKISVFMNVFNVHSNKSPVDGEIKGHWYTPGSFVNADLDKASRKRTQRGVDTVCARRCEELSIAGLARGASVLRSHWRQAGARQRFGFSASVRGRRLSADDGAR